MIQRVCALLLLVNGFAFAGVEDKYRQLRTISIGSILITEPHVTIVGPQAIGAGRERVTFLHLDHGIIHIQGASEKEIIDAEIGQGNDKDPAANFGGTFELQNGSLVGLTLDKLHLRLRRAKSTVTLFHGGLKLDPNSDLFIDNSGILTVRSRAITGSVTLTMFGSQLVAPALLLQGTSVNATLPSSMAKQNVIALDLAQGSFTAQDATYTKLCRWPLRLTISRREPWRVRVDGPGAILSVGCYRTAGSSASLLAFFSGSFAASVRISFSDALPRWECEMQVVQQRPKLG